MSPKQKRRAKPKKVSSSSCTKVPRPLLLKSLRTTQKCSPPPKSKTKPKPSPTDSGISTEKEPSSASASSFTQVLPPDGYYDPGGILRLKKPCIPTTIGCKSGCGPASSSHPPSEYSLSLENIEAELQFSDGSVKSGPSIFDEISSDKLSRSSFSSPTSYTCSNSSCLSDSSLSSSEGEHKISAESEILSRISELQQTLRNWDSFLAQNGIKQPDFFCRYKERVELEKYLNKFAVSGAPIGKSVKAIKRRRGLARRSFSLGENWQLKKTQDFQEYEKAAKPRGKWKSFGFLGPEQKSGKDATSSNEAAHLQQKLKSLSTELVTLRNRLHVNANGQPHPQGPSSHRPGENGDDLNSLPQVPPHQGQSGNGRPNHHNYMNHPLPSYPNKPLPPQPHCNGSQGYYENQPFQQKEVVRIGGDILGVSNCSSTLHPDKLGVGVVHGIPPARRDRSRERDATQSQASSGSCALNSASGGAASGSLILGSNCASNSNGTASTPSESSFRISHKSLERERSSSRSRALSQKSSSGQFLSRGSSSSKRRKVNLAEVEDLIHLIGPLTEDAIIRCVQARVAANKFSVHMGPILLLTNRLTSTNNPLTLGSTSEFPISPDLQGVVVETLRQQADTGYPQAIILSGVSGAGKTYTSMLILRQLFLLAGGGTSSDAFKHLSASITVLRSLGTASTVLNRDSSRVGHFIEVQVTEGTVYRTKVHCYFLDQTRVVKTPVDEKNYDIFYQMLAGLSQDERERLHLGQQCVETLRYLNKGDVRTDEKEDKRRFLEWKASLGMLGIPFLDVVRVLAAVILMGNVKFRESKSSSSSCTEVDVQGEIELQSAAALLGVSESALKQGLTNRTHNVRNTLVKSRVDANSCNFNRDSLAKSLYTRTVSTIVRRANSLKRLGSNSGTLSSDSADSVHNQAEVLSQHASTVGTAGSKASKSMTALNNAVRHATDGFIGILDMFGFEDLRPSHLEQLCINLCAETMQHFYNTHIFKASIESCRDEGITSDWEVEYVDNVPSIDLISSLRTGLLSMLDVECAARGTVESYVGKVTSQLKSNPRLLPQEKSPLCPEMRSFSIQHYAGKVIYDATEFLDTNRDILADDLVAAFHKHRCSFGFASHLFSSELKILGAGGMMEPSPRGISFRISPTSSTELLNGDEPVSTLTQDFHTRLDNLLRTLVHAKPHFIRCIKMNQNEAPDLFDRHIVSKQLRAFQVLETVNLMANGYPHRMRFKAFHARYKLLGPFHQYSRNDDRALEDCQLILDSFDSSANGSFSSSGGKDRNISISWAVGKRHIFLSEGARQQLESLRVSTRTRAATLLQSTWRGFQSRQRWPLLRQGFHHHRRFNQGQDIPPNLPPPNPHPKPQHQHLPVPEALTSRPPTATSTLPRQQPFLPPPAPKPSFHSGYPSSATNTLNLRHNPSLNSGTTQSLPHLQTFHPQTQLSPTSVFPVTSTSNPEMGRLASSSSATPPLQSFGTSGSLSPPILPPITPVNGHSIATATIAPATNVAATNGTMGHHSGCSSGSVHSSTSNSRPPRPAPISGTPPPEQVQQCDPKLVQQTCNMFGLDMERPPPLPPSRSYTVTGNTKLGYPQTRVMKMTYPDEGTPSDIRLLKGDSVAVIGTSPRRGHLMVEVKNRTIHVPFQYLELKTTSD